MYRESLLAEGCFQPTYPKVIQLVADTIPGNMPDKMKLLMAATELIVFTSHLRKNILWHGSSIPVNTISFLIGGSGEGKGLSIKSVSNVLKGGYAVINKQREDNAKAIAVEDAEADGKKATEWRKYYSKPRDLKSAISTLPGTMKHLAALERNKLGSGYMYVDEIGSELVSNKDLSENIVALAIGYDSGEIQPKILKDDTNQVEGIKNLPYSALMFGSPANIIFDEQVKRKFKEEFSTKLSRRSFFAFIQETPKRLVFSNIADSRKYAKDERDRTFKATQALAPWFTGLVEATTQKPLEVTEEVEDLFSDYHGYNEWFADTISKQYPMSILHRKHLQWKSLKLAGALAILENETIITKEHMVAAINFSEIYAEDLIAFEIELAKEPYELFADYMLSISTNGYANASIHKLRKMNFVKGNGSAQNKMLELIDLARSYDDVNRYEYAEGYIHFYEAADGLIEERGELV